MSLWPHIFGPPCTAQCAVQALYNGPMSVCPPALDRSSSDASARRQLTIDVYKRPSCGPRHVESRGTRYVEHAASDGRLSQGCSHKKEVGDA